MSIYTVIRMYAVTGLEELPTPTYLERDAAYEQFAQMNETCSDADKNKNANMLIMLMLLSVLFITSTCVNIIVLTAFYKKKSLRTISNRFVEIVPPFG